MGPRSSSPANLDASVSYFSVKFECDTIPPSTCVHLEFLPTFPLYVLALKQTQAVDPQIKAEAQAEASTESPEPVSTEAVQRGGLV